MVLEHRGPAHDAAFPADPVEARRGCGRVTEHLADGPAGPSRGTGRRQPDSPSGQFLGVDRLGLELAADRGRGGDADHQGEHEGPLAGDLRDDHYGGDRGAGRPGEHGGHPDEGDAAGRGARAQETESVGEQGAGHRAEEQRRCEHAAGAADGEGQARRDELADQQDRQEPCRVAAVDGLLEDRIADPVHLRAGRTVRRPARSRPRRDAATPVHARAGRRGPRCRRGSA